MIQTKEKETLASLLALIFKLQDETSFRDNFKRKQALDSLIKYAQSIGFTLEPDNPEFLPKLFLKILQEYNKPPELPPGNLPPPELVEIYEKGKQEEEARLQKLMASEKVFKDYKDYVNLYKNFILKNKQELPPKVAEEIAKNAANRTIISLPRVAQPEFLSKEDKNRIIREAGKIIEDELQKIKTEEGKPQIVREAEKIVGNEWERIIEETKKIAAKPEIIQSVEEITRAEKPPPTPEEIPPLPQEVLAKLNQPPETVTFLPIYTIFHPKVGVAFIRKVTNAVPAYFVKLAVENAPPDWQASKGWPIIQEMVGKRIFIEDLQASVKALKEMGIPDSHPLIQKFEDRIAKFLEVQKNPKTNKDYPWVTVLKRDSFWDKFTGRKRIEDEDLGYLPRLSPNLAWSQEGYANFLRRGLNRFHFVVNIYERFSKFVTGGKHTSFFVPIRQFFSQKITQPVIKWLAKTAAGKAVKAGAKKAAGWVATKLGVKLAAEAGVAAIGAATGPPGWVVALVTIGLDVLKFVGKKIIGLIQKIVQKPENALVTAGVGALVLIFVPMPFGSIGVVPLVFGGIGLLSWATAPATLSAAAGGFGAFFSAISTLTFAAPIGLFVIILLSTVAVLTLLVMLVVSGAFILPKQVQEATITTVSPYTSEYFDITKTASSSHLENSDLKNLPEIKYKITITSKGEKLKITDIKEEININVKEGKQLSITPHSFEEEFQEKGREIVSSWDVEYTRRIGPGFEDSAIINTVMVSLSIEDNSEIIGIHQGMATAVVTIGKPPGDCPSGWPTSSQISQGPEGATSHWPHLEEAIDMSNIRGTPIHASHNGTASIHHQPGKGAGYYVRVSGICNGKLFTTEYYHMEEYGRVSGEVSKGQIIGFMGNSGTGGVHLHYEFRPKRTWVDLDTKTQQQINSLPMEPRYIPVRVPRRCNSKSACNITTIY